MRLLDANTLELHDGGVIPKAVLVHSYAILSHTWGEDEVMFNDLTDAQKMNDHREKNTAGYQKVMGACNAALKKGCTYIWIDTCCIDKSSSAELSEAINSMFHWYCNSHVCLAHLSDVTRDAFGIRKGFDQSRWFRRGWTLQELIAPIEVEFYDAEWRFIGTRATLIERISDITLIEEPYLRQPGPTTYDLRELTVAMRMGWASRRETTREEDMAYCLMGIFDVNMPLLYGERSKAFTRLQEEIIRQSHDQSILAWRRMPHHHPKQDFLPFFADSPARFNIKTFGGQQDPGRFTLRLTARGLEASVWMAPCEYTHDNAGIKSRMLAVLDCSLTRDAISRPAILLESTGSGTGVYRRLCENLIIQVGPGSYTVCKLDGSEGSKYINYDESKFQVKEILLENRLNKSTRLEAFPFRLNIDSQHLTTLSRASFSTESLMSEKISRDRLLGVNFFRCPDPGVDFVVWWGVTFRAVPSYKGEPFFGTSGTPFCYVQSWTDLTGHKEFDEDIAKGHWRSILSGKPFLAAPEQQQPQTPERMLAIKRQLGSVQRKYLKQGQPVKECYLDGLWVRAAIEAISFLDRTSIEMTITVEHASEANEQGMLVGRDYK